MRSLFITRRFLDDGEAPVTGSYQRMGMFLEALGRISQSLHIIAMAPPDYQAGLEADRHIRSLYERLAGREVRLTIVPRLPPAPAASAFGLLRRPWDFCAPEVHSYYMTAGSAAIATVTNALAEAPDAVFVHRLSAMVPLLRGRLQHRGILFDLDDIEHRAFVRHVLTPPFWWSKVLRLLHAPAVMLAERRAARMARRTYVCSDADRDDLARLTGASGIVAIPNAVRLPETSPVPKAPTLLFLGSGIFEPNRYGASWLIEHVLPRIRAGVPEARLLLAGEHQENIRSFSRPPPGVEFRGFVADLPALYRETRVVTCPILSGSGTRVKIVEAAAHRRPIVSTRIGAEGLSLEDGRAILLRDTPEAFADACIALLQDDALAERLAAAAREVAEHTYDRAKIVERISQDMRAALAD